ncbi:QacE family quaternary ammonium compound efflux SMR transporter [Bifidobacterium pseudolongum]|uniref:DMT family transporter n=1 Tax=Bifidobacterium pseudolongum TaxID=1694 RepID=UPI00102217DF|nr:SMR family transporter [Bifidobacterium pseudolongum]MCH4852498.1 QacE family quaternary ammonium compound efflux SMR transporter [Bifidobacterium pseudolongum]RYQ06388.1 ligand-binding protein SH3 [Bifidobacterium pseudolongum subsp. globosum]RYQ13182.1 ligand-binding protein SH3 [Bifidobacterium pseudolongum subsp. globosum]RYQ67755.1 ligand-binding protein SH3 [Bifidobacterium pseudolongum subsp. globosum]RYQ71063.1 ligand-binding protein SH3 [Bifidobacterium pseudolongum subsp. globosum
MAWIVLVLSGICEAVWAVALDKSQGFTKIIPVIVFFCGLAASMAGLSYAMRSISVGTAYLIWVGIGAAITVSYLRGTHEQKVA